MFKNINKYFKSMESNSELRIKYPCGASTYEIYKARSNFNCYEGKKKKAKRLNFHDFIIMAAGSDWMALNHNIHPANP